MYAKGTLAVLVSITVFAASAVALAETTAETFAKGDKYLAKGEFEKAMQSFAAAARAEQGNQEYVQHYAMARRIVDFRDRLKTEKSPQQWDYIAKALRAFYVSERIYPELLKLDENIHQRQKSAESAEFLAETQLAMEKNVEAYKTLSEVERSKATDMTRLLLGIAMARNAKAAEAKRMAGEIKLPDDAGPRIVYTAARLHAATGNSAKTMELLKTCFETTLPSQLDGFKSHAKTCPEFSAIASTSEFANVLKTESKIPESKCSGGSSCAGCPMKGKCPKSQSQ